MATNLSNFDSLGGFSVGETTHIDEGHNAMSLNSIEMKNLFYGDSKTTNYILRGLRNSSDFKYEKGIAQMNRSMKNHIDTIFIITEPEVSHISSTLVRDIVKNGGDVSQFVPDGVTI